MQISDDEFDALVEEEFDALPPELTTDIDNLVILVDDEPEEGEDLLGIYEGVALTERDTTYAGMLPDRITLFRGPLTRAVADVEELRDEIHVTLVHEIGHYHGIDEKRLHELGWG